MQVLISRQRPKGNKAGTYIKQLPDFGTMHPEFLPKLRTNIPFVHTHRLKVQSNFDLRITKH